MPIIVDLSQTIMASCVVQLANELVKSTPEDAVKLIKHMTFTTLLSYKKKYGKEFGDLVIACDGRNYWRKEFFPWYKGNRKHARKESPLDFTVVFQAVNEIKEDIREYFPWKIVEVNRAEADDVIACLCKYHFENELATVGLFDGEPKPCLILSSDGDFVQLQQYPHVKQYSYITKKWIKPKTTARDYLMEHILRGDGGDNICNVLTEDQWSIDKANGLTPDRQTSIKASFQAEVVKLGEAAIPERYKANWNRNRVLIDFNSIPQDVRDSIIDTYTGYKAKGNKMRLMTYFTKNRMSKLYEQINDF
jgi:hypothetical protein